MNSPSHCSSVGASDASSDRRSMAASDRLSPRAAMRSRSSYPRSRGAASTSRIFAIPAAGSSTKGQSAKTRHRRFLSESCIPCPVRTRMASTTANAAGRRQHDTRHQQAFSRLETGVLVPLLRHRNCAEHSLRRTSAINRGKSSGDLCLASGRLTGFTLLPQSFEFRSERSGEPLAPLGVTGRGSAIFARGPHQIVPVLPMKGTIGLW